MRGKNEVFYPLFLLNILNSVMIYGIIKYISVSEVISKVWKIINAATFPKSVTAAFPLFMP